MDWILNHLQLLIVLGGAVAWWLNQRRALRTGDEAGPPDASQPDDSEQAERTRRIREVIQRKIEQRAQEQARPSTPVEAPPLVQPAAEPVRPVASHARRGMTKAEERRQAEILEQQASLTVQLQQARDLKQSIARRTVYEAKVTSESAAASPTRGSGPDELRDPAALRRAIVLREILGPPVALRR